MADLLLFSVTSPSETSYGLMRQPMVSALSKHVDTTAVVLPAASNMVLTKAINYLIMNKFPQQLRSCSEG